MIKDSSLRGMSKANKLVGCKIKHLGRGTEYTIIHTGWGRAYGTDGWFEVVTYIGKDRRYYTRPTHMFHGFVWVRKRQPLWVRLLVKFKLFGVK